jgi:hypothetical protein
MSLDNVIVQTEGHADYMYYPDYNTSGYVSSNYLWDN